MRSFWYGFRTSHDTGRTRTKHKTKEINTRGRTPRTKSPMAIAGKYVSAVPKSGWRATRPIGTRVIRHALAICANVIYRLLRNSERYRAKATTTIILINSEG